MLTNRERRKLMGYIKNADIPMLMLIGWGIGFLITGIMWIILGTFMEAGENEIWSFKAILSGLLVVGISALLLKYIGFFLKANQGRYFPD